MKKNYIYDSVEELNILYSAIAKFYSERFFYAIGYNKFDNVEIELINKLI